MLVGERNVLTSWHSALLPSYLRMLPYHRRILPANSQGHLHSPYETQQHQWCSPSSSFKTASKSTVPSSRTKLAITPLTQRQNPPGEMVRTVQRKPPPPQLLFLLLLPASPLPNLLLQQDEEKVKLKGEVHRLIAPRDQKHQSNFVEFRSTKIVYRRYAGLFFCVCVDANDNELAYLEAIHFFVEVLDAFFGNVCELDLVFNFYKVSWGCWAAVECGHRCGGDLRV